MANGDLGGPGDLAGCADRGVVRLGRGDNGSWAGNRRAQADPGC